MHLIHDIFTLLGHTRRYGALRVPTFRGGPHFFGGWGSNERPGLDHVIGGPMRGLRKNCTQWHRQTDKQTYMATLKLSRPSGAELVNISKKKKLLIYFWKFLFSPKTIFYPLSFPILGQRNLTRPLQSSPFYISGWGYRERYKRQRTNKGKTSCLILDL